MVLLGERAVSYAPAKRSVLEEAGLCPVLVLFLSRYPTLQAAGTEPLQAAGTEPLQAAGTEPLKAPGTQPLEAPGAQPLKALGTEPPEAPGAKPLSRFKVFRV